MKNNIPRTPKEKASAVKTAMTNEEFVKMLANKYGVKSFATETEPYILTGIKRAIIQILALTISSPIWFVGFISGLLSLGFSHGRAFGKEIMEYMK